MRLTDWLGDGRRLVPHQLRPPRDGFDRQGHPVTSTTSPSTSSTSARCASRSTTSAATAAGSAGARRATASAATSPPTSGSSRRSASSSCTATWSSLQPDHQPRRWPDDRFSSNTWGPLPPRSYFRFDQAAIDSERESLEMLGIQLPHRTDASQTRGRNDTAGLHRSPRTGAGAPAWFRRRHGTTSATSSSSTSTPIPTPPPRCCRRASSPSRDAGRCAAVFVDWQSFSEGGDELIDPVRSQYREFYRRDQRAAGRRTGHDLSVHLGRPGLRAGPRLDPGLSQEARRDLDDPQLRPQCQASPPLAAGSRFGATCSARGRELARTIVTLEHESETGPVHTDPAAGQRPALPAAGGRPPRRAGGARAGPRSQPGPRDLDGLGGRRRAQLLRRARRGA